MIISVASGKGGTGKTTVAVNLALSIREKVQFLDCDVEEPNAHIFLKPAIEEKRQVFIPVPEIDELKCTYCGKCREVCAYGAVAVIKSVDSGKGSVLVFPNLCHGCGSCSYFCPQQAIKEVNKEVGEIEAGYVQPAFPNADVRFVHGRLNIGEAMAPPVIREVKKYVVRDRITIIDAPPGTSCPVITSIKDSDFCLLVTEPTPFGLNDLLLAVEVVRKLSLPFGVVINRSDLGDDKTETYCQKEDIPVIMRIPFQKEIAVAYSHGKTIIEAVPSYQVKFQELYRGIAEGNFS
ncbi:MAG: ATP-binding protein [Candidatus Aureabacteria bacterium]|nr:ATP-binding protein [Candidatus Auribacterota bacterium]